MKFHYFLLIFLFLSAKAEAQFSTMEVLEGRKSISIPFEYIQGFIIVEVRLNGILPLNFLFDTGAENTLLLEDVYARLLGIKLEEEVHIIGSDKSQVNVGHIARRIPMKFVKGGGFDLDLVVLKEKKLDFNNIVGREIDGIIGGNMFIGAVIEIDYKRGNIIFHNPNKFNKPKKYYEETIDVIKQRPFVNTSISVAGETRIDSLKLLMDTGAGIHILFDESSHPKLKMPDSIVDGRIGDGIGGQLGGFLGNVQLIQFLDEEFRNEKVYFQTTEDEFDKHFHNHRNGILGNVYWERKKVIIDYPRRKLYTKSRFKKKREFKFNKSGMVVFAVGPDLDQYIVKYVAKNTAADIAGFKAGDLIVSFNGYPRDLISLDYINRKLAGKEGKKIRLTIKRNNERLKKQLILRNIL